MACLKSLIFGFDVYSVIVWHNIAINEKTPFLITNNFASYLGLDARKPVFGGFANNKDAQTSSLISAFVVRLLESIISRLAMFSS